MTIPTTVMISGKGLSERLIGGKGAALDRLLAKGARVPQTGTITTGGYRQFVTASELSGYLDELRSSPTPAPDQLEEATRQVELAFLDAPMPGALEEEILSLAESVRGPGSLAIRSSATAEDMSSASFAGQYRSFLDVRTPEAILESVRLVWSSLWLPAPRSYRRFRGIDERDLEMAVVVMRLVDARLAGVVFTLDPGGEPASVRLEAVEGFGEKLVSGEVTPATYVIPRLGRRDGLTDPVLDEAVDMALQVEEWFGQPQDVEWAYDGEQLYLVQARPITTVPLAVGDDDGFDTEPMESCTYTTAGIAEMVPGMVPPLVWTTIGPLLEDAFRRLFDRLDALPEELSRRYGMIGRFRGRAALNLDLLKLVAAELPGGSSDDLERQYFGRIVTEASDDASKPPPGRKAGGLRMALQATKEIRARNHFARDAEIAINAIQLVIVSRVDMGAMPDDKLVAYRRRLLDLASRAIAAEVAVAAAAAAAYRGVELFLEDRLPADEVAVWAQRLTSGGMHTCGGHMAFSVCDLVQDGLASRVLAESLTAEVEPAEIRTRLNESAEGRELLGALDELLQLGGSAAVFAGPTWAEQQDLVWQVLRQALDSGRVLCPDCGATAAGCQCGTQEIAAQRSSSDRSGAFADLERRVMRTIGWRTTRLLTGQIIDLRKRILRRMVADAFEFLDRRERAKTAILRLGGEVRRAHVEMGRRLAGQSAIQLPGDIDYLSAAEVDAAFAGGGPIPEVIARRRRQHDLAASEGSLPQLFEGRPPPAETQEITGDAFVGWGGSPGRHRGESKVVRSPADQLERGQIMVARSTDPSWTPLFLAAGAIIVEEGGPLSHAAIVARELGLPAVLNIPGIVDRLEGSAQEVTVDGTAGTVTIHQDREEPDEVAA